MAICSALSAGIAKSCDTNTGGILKLYIADFENVTSYTEVSGEITAITMAAGTKFYEFQFNRNTSSIEETINVSLENGTTFFEQRATLVLSRREKTKREAIKKLAAGQKQLAIIVKDSNNLYWFIGLTDGAILQELAGGSGVAKSDANNYQLTFVAQEPNPMPEVDDAIISAIVTI